MLGDFFLLLPSQEFQTLPLVGMEDQTLSPQKLLSFRSKATNINLLSTKGILKLDDLLGLC